MNNRVRHVMAGAVLSAMMLAGHAGPAAGQVQADPAVELVQKFGRGGTLPFDGLRKYLASREFKGLDANEDGQLDFDEYVAAGLYVRRDTCLVAGNASANWQTEKQEAAGPLDADALYAVNPVWKAHVGETAAAHWGRAGRPRDAALTLDEVRDYLAREKARVPKVPAAADRLKALTALLPAGAKVAGETQLIAFFRDERYRAVDRDGGGSLDFFEFTRGFKYPGAASEFCAFASSGFSIAKSAFDNITLRVQKAPALHDALSRSIDAARMQLSLASLDVPLTDVERAFRAQETAARDAAAIEGVGGHGLVPDFGYLVKGGRKEDDGEVTWDKGLSSVFLRVIKDFTFDDPAEAEPAVFAVSKAEGKPATYTVDATAQVDFRPVSATLQRISFGVDIERFTAEKAERHSQTVFAAIDLFLFPGGRGVESHYLRFAPFVEHDELKDTTRLGGDIVWQPGIHVGRFLTSDWRPIGRSVDWYMTPRAVLELATALQQPEDAEDADETHARLELLWGLRIGKQANVSFKTFQRWGIGNDLGYSHFEELSAWWNFDAQKRFSLKVSATSGRETPTSDAGKAVKAGLGVRF